MGLFKKAVESAKAQAKAQVEQARTDALARVEQAKADTLRKVEQVKTDVQLTRNHPAAALEEYRGRKAAREVKRLERAEAKAEEAAALARAAEARAHAERAERIAKATGPDGKIRAKGVVWDGRVLLLEGRAVSEVIKETKTVTSTQGRVDGSALGWGQSQRFTTIAGVQRGRSVSRTSEVDVPRPLKKGQTVFIPAERIGGVAHEKVQVRVFVTDGREYLFKAPQALAEAIEARAEEILAE